MAAIRDDNIGKSIQIESSKPSSKRNVQKDKRNKKTQKNVSRKYTIVGNVVSLQAGQDNPLNKLTSDLVGATLSVTNPHTLVDTSKYPSTRYTLPTTYSTTISKVINETTFEVSEPYYVTDDTAQKIPVSLKTGDVSITYDTYKTETENAVFQRSFAELTIGNLRTFSGDVYKAKIYTRDSHTSTDFEEIYDTFVVPENILVDSTSINGYENIGFFHTGSIVANSWISSSTAGDLGEFVTLNNEKLIDGLLISGSTENLEDKILFRTRNSFDLERGVDYVVRFNSYYFKSVSERRDDNNQVSSVNHASLKIYLSGSAVTGQNGEDDFFLGEVDVPDSSANEGSIPDIIGRFRTAGSGSPKAWLKFELNSGRFIIQDVSVEPFSETNFNPSYFKVLAPMPRPVRRGDKYDFLVEFYDANNNIAETTAQVNGVTFQGPRQVIADGLDGVLSGSLLVGQSLELYGVNPAYLRSVGYQGFDNTISGGTGGFMIFSGSVGTRITASESYEGVGLEIVDAHSSFNRYLKFRTNPSQFEVVTDSFFFGRDGQFISGSGGTIAISSSNFFLGDSNGAYISGSSGNLEISSSNFSVDVDGNVTMSGFVSASGGHIGNFQIVEGKISGSNITMDANTSTIYKTDQGPGSDPQAPGFESQADEYYIDFTPSEETPNNYYIKFGPNFMVDKDGILIASGATFVGTITASAGLLGGFTIGSASLFNGSEGTPNFFFSGSANGSNFDKGNLFISSSGFQVNSQGAISASAGQIGGFNINTDGLNSDSNEFQITGSTGQVTGSQVLFTGGKIGGWTLSNSTLTGGSVTIDSSGIIRSATDLTTGDGFFLNATTFRIGNATGQRLLFDGTNTEIYDSSNNKLVTLGGTNEIAGWTIGTTTISKNNLILNSAGQISSQGYASNQQGFFLGMRPLADGSVGAYLEVDEAQIRGTLKTTVFEKESVNAVGGQLHIANSTTITGSVSMSTTDTTIQVANASGFSAGEIIQLKKFNPTGFTTEYMKIHSVSLQDAASATNFSGSFEVTRSLGTSALSGTISGSIGFSGSSAQSYTPGQVIVSTGKIGTGYIRLNANPNDATTPYMDIVERTGSGVYDVDLKARLGDLSGITDTINGTAVSGFGLYTDNAFLKGGIVATYGSIGGLEIESNKIYFGTGTYNNSNTEFYVDNSGQFSLGDKLSWNGSTLSITGDITVSNPEDFIQPSETGSFTKNSATSSLENPTDYSFGGDATFPLNALPGTITTAGLYLGSNNLGYHNGTDYKTYMDSSGRFYLGGTSGALQWDGANLSVTGTITITNFDSTYGTLITGSFNDASSSFSTRTTNAESTGSTLTIDSGSLASSVKIEGTGISIDNRSGTSLALLTNTLRIGRNTNGQSRLEIDSSGNLSIINKSSGGVDSNVIQLLANGNASFSGSGTFGGEIQGSSGEIGGFSIATTGLTSTGVGMFPSGQTYAFTAGTGGTPPFRVTHAGVLTATSATITGNVTATTLTATSAGSIGGWTINSTNIEKDGVRLNAGSNNGYLGIGVTSYNTNNGIWIGETSSGLYQMSLKNSGGTKYFKWDGTNLEVDAGNFSLDSSGNITATSVDLTGEIKATTGVIGGWNISGTTLTSNDNSIVLDEGNNRIDIVGTTTVGGSSVDTKIRLDADAGKGSEISLQRDDFGGSLINFVELHTSQSYFENSITSYSSGSTRDDVSYTLDANNSETIVMAGSTTWGSGVVYLRSDGTTLNDVVVESAISAGQLLSTGEANLITEIQLRNLTEQANASGTGKSLFRWKGEVFQNSVNSTTGAELVGSFRVSSTLNIGAAASAINIQQKFLLTKQFFYVKFSGVEFDVLTASGTSNDDWTLAATASPIAAVKYLPKVVTSGIGQQFAAGPNQEAKFGARNEIIGSYKVKQTTANTEGNISIEGKASIGTPDIDDTFDLFVDGAIGATGNIVGYYSSDERLKENIIEIKEGLSIVNQLRPVKFDWKQDSPFGHLYPTEYGLIAQEVEQVVPEIVGTMKHNYKGINYESLVPLLIQSIKELTERIEELEKDK